jgi:glutathione-regulated potassium-efflux system ancillary protein KefG
VNDFKIESGFYSSLKSLFWVELANSTEMQKILILFAHPAAHKSKINKALAESVKHEHGITVNNLYERYPDFYIDIVAEQQLLLEHDIIVWQHPFYWYSGPALLKEWFDLVLQHGFAYGEKGRRLEGKKAMSVITTGGKREVYSAQGRNHFTINEFLVPYRQSANLCLMDYLPPFVVHGAHTISDEEIKTEAARFKKLMQLLRDDLIDGDTLKSATYLNDIKL